MRKRLTLVAALAAASSFLVVTQLAAGASSSAVRVIATGLNNPRGVEVAPDGSVFVAQAGATGKKCMKGGGEGSDETCVGFTGSIDRVAGGQRERWAAGFFSAGGRDGSFAVGMDDIAIAPDGAVYGIQTAVGPKPEQYGKKIARQSGFVFRIDRGKHKRIGENVAEYEFKNNPANDNVDSDPYGIAWSPLGLAVADAAGNSLLLVPAKGRKPVTTLATFKGQIFGGHAAQSVPTSVVWHNGAFYVGELGGGGTPNGRSRIWKVVPGEKPTVWATGFTAITGIAFGPDGSLFVTELAKNGLDAAFEKGDLTGALIRVWPDGHRTEVAPGRLMAPAGAAVGADGTVYVSNFSLFRSKGQLLAITP
ncbi:MAG TPA: ScyD/ScyE family protein [Gaiellaceae bacterium]|nr:ScyD/ScyE family protein [Gaiellaceae bacterium]